MHFTRASGTYHVHKAARGRAANDGVVHHHHAFATQHFANRVVLHFHLRVASGLSRLKERPPDVVISNQRQLERKSRLFGETERGRVGRIRNAEDEIRRRGGEVARQTATKLSPRPVHRAAKYLAVGTREVDVLEDALFGVHLLEREDGAHPAFIDGDDLTALHFALERRSEEIESAALRREDRGVAEPAHHQWPPPARIARRQQRVSNDDRETIGSLYSLQRIGEPMFRLN